MPQLFRSSSFGSLKSVFSKQGGNDDEATPPVPPIPRAFQEGGEEKKEKGGSILRKIRSVRSLRSNSLASGPKVPSTGSVSQGVVGIPGMPSIPPHYTTSSSPARRAATTPLPPPSVRSTPRAAFAPAPCIRPLQVESVEPRSDVFHGTGQAQPVDVTLRRPRPPRRRENLRPPAPSERSSSIGTSILDDFALAAQTPSEAQPHIPSERFLPDDSPTLGHSLEVPKTRTLAQPSPVPSERSSPDESPTLDRPLKPLKRRAVAQPSPVQWEKSQDIKAILDAFPIPPLNTKDSSSLSETEKLKHRRETLNSLEGVVGLGISNEGVEIPAPLNWRKQSPHPENRPRSMAQHHQHQEEEENIYNVSPRAWRRLRHQQGDEDYNASPIRKRRYFLNNLEAQGYEQLLPATPCRLCEESTQLCPEHQGPDPGFF